MIKRIAGLGLALALGFAPSAHAESVYRYWSYWQGEAGSWQFAQVGVGSVAVADGQVQGWRFVTSGAAGSKGLAPRVSPDFAQICAGIPAAPDVARVAVVIDFGDTADNPGAGAPPAPLVKCLKAAPGTSSAALMTDNLDIRSKDAFVCGINGWPAAGCGEPVDATAPAASDAQQDQLARVVTILLGVILFAVTWRGLMRQKGWTLRK